MYSYTATIGRNVGTDPMPLTTWEQFIEDVTADLSVYLFRNDDVVELHRGKGVWDGIEEESAKITLLKSSPLEEPALDNLRRALSELARLYSQDAIALTIGQSELC